MIRTAVLTLAALAGFSAAARAQTDCVQAGLLSIDQVTTGTQRVPRDPRGSDLVTISIAVRNLSAAQQNFSVRFQAPPVQQNFVEGQMFRLPAGQRTTIALANVLKPGMTDGTVRAMARLSCY